MARNVWIVVVVAVAVGFAASSHCAGPESDANSGSYPNAVDSGTTSYDRDSECILSLLPCKAFLNTTEPPSSACCIPLKKSIETNAVCLCHLIHNTPLFISINGNQTMALEMPKRCRLIDDVSLCDKILAMDSSSNSPLAVMKALPKEGMKGSSDASKAPSKAPFGLLLSLAWACICLIHSCP
ncbi:non-specific lipid transfer protein GPI-anchored 2 [Amborella trichopoda]|uniref:non-specific lipid transfer protein GPI-anchored 2 n=1 Tax=Amborella trichopoda TaxID=13333 RepID=UPI0005D3E2A6|nr:non-specific lipid transfer protein GPI-anchored 2 [Amborella trichopoda]|eukprot:XP_006844197.2 non-specific lipid transfer protein GPI-anchored 2 [Amborella trichopoda]